MLKYIEYVYTEADKMSDVIRIFVEKRDGFNVEAKHTLWDIRHNLRMMNVTDLRYIVRYDIEGLPARNTTRRRALCSRSLTRT